MILEKPPDHGADVLCIRQYDSERCDVRRQLVSCREEQSQVVFWYQVFRGQDQPLQAGELIELIEVLEFRCSLEFICLFHIDLEEFELGAALFERRRKRSAEPLRVSRVGGNVDVFHGQSLKVRCDTAPNFIFEAEKGHTTT